MFLKPGFDERIAALTRRQVIERGGAGGAGDGGRVPLGRVVDAMNCVACSDERRLRLIRRRYGAVMLR